MSNIFNSQYSQPHNHSEPKDQPQSTLFKRNQRIPQHFLSRIKPEFCIESGNKASPHSFLSEEALSRSQNNRSSGTDSGGNHSGGVHNLSQKSNSNSNNRRNPQNWTPQPQSHFKPQAYGQAMSLHSFDSKGSGTNRQNGDRGNHPKSAYTREFAYRSNQRFHPQQPPQHHYGYNYSGYGNYLHAPKCNHGSNSNSNSGRMSYGKRKRACNCSRKRETLAAKLILKSMSSGNQAATNERNLVNNFVRHFRFFGQNLEESRKKHYKNILENTSSSLKRAKLCPNLPKELTEEQIEELRQGKYEEMDLASLRRMCEEGKESSNKLQNYLNFTDPQNCRKIYQKMKHQVYDLCFNKYANYIVQLFIEKISELDEVFTTMFIDNFDEMVSNQYASRVLQKMVILKNSKFIDFAIDRLKTDYKFFLKDLSSMIFTTKLVTECNRPDSFGFFEKIIMRNPSIILKEPNLIRILVSVFTVCDKDMLSRLFEHLIPYVWNIINHKFGMYIVQKVIERDIKPHKEMVVKTCLDSLSEMVDKRYSKYVLFKVIEFDEERKFVRRFLAKILKDEALLFERILKMNDSTCLFLLSILSLNSRELKYLFPKVNAILMKDCTNFENRMQCK